MTIDECVDLQEEIKSLKAELIEFLDEAIRCRAYLVKDGEMAGWWDSMASSDVCDFGDRLVELNVWERHPDGYGRRWFYRPKKKDIKHELAPQSAGPRNNIYIFG